MFSFVYFKWAAPLNGIQNQSSRSKFNGNDNHRIKLVVFFLDAQICHENDQGLWSS